MREYRQPSVALLVVALSCATAALLALGLELNAVAIAAGAAGCAAVAVESGRMSLPKRRADPALIDRLVEQAKQGRKLAIYDRDTGLFAHWYLGLRGQEECARAARYGRSVSLLIIEPSAARPEDGWRIKSEIGQWIRAELRATDIAGYLGNSRFAVVAPEADGDAVEGLVERLLARIPDSDVGVSAFPDDGYDFPSLWRRAAARLGAQGPLEDAA